MDKRIDFNTANTMGRVILNFFNEKGQPKTAPVR